jgi:HD-GYP domain-containing protein (c-di-GMP phosphodiesterase class II)
MTADRSYRKALPPSVAVAELRKHSGTQFCPAVVDALVELVLEAEAAASADEPAWELSVAPEAAPAAPAALPAPHTP